MDGVTILNTYETIYDYSAGWNNNAIISIIVILIGIAIIVRSVWLGDIDIFPLGLIIAAVGIFATMFIISTTVPHYRYEYQVTIDETVSLKQFNEKYEIIDQEGLIYTIYEKEKN